MVVLTEAQRSKYTTVLYLECPSFNYYRSAFLIIQIILLCLGLTSYYFDELFIIFVVPWRNIWTSTRKDLLVAMVIRLSMCAADLSLSVFI